MEGVVHGYSITAFNYRRNCHVTFLEDEPAVEGEEDLLNALNADSELNINNGGNDKIQAIIEHAANGDESFDDIMNEWNQKWTDAQESEGVEITE